MDNRQMMTCLPSEMFSMERVRYFTRQLITPDDLTLEQEYFRNKLRRHNRFLHGWGVVCGCIVRPAYNPSSGTNDPWMVRISPGYVLGPYGDEILVEREKPAHCDYHLCVIEPRMRVGFQARVGIDTIVASHPTELLLDGQAQWGFARVAPEIETRRQAGGSLGQDTIGQKTTLT